LERIVEYRVRNQPAGVIRQFGCIIHPEGIAITVGNLIGSPGHALELIGIERLDISSVVLEEVGEAVVEKNWRLQVVVNAELQCTYVGI
jgi:hypothetical protein